MKTAFVLGAFATLMVAGAAVATLATVDLTAVDGGIHYVNDDATVWEESNDCEGLQTEPVDCRGDEELEPADKQTA